MTDQTDVSSIAANVIAKCGGVRKTAALLGRDPSWVYKWTYPKGKSAGRGGLVPDEDAQALMAAARRGEVDLTPADFFPSEATKTPSESP